MVASKSHGKLLVFCILDDRKVRWVNSYCAMQIKVWCLISILKKNKLLLQEHMVHNLLWNLMKPFPPPHSKSCQESPALLCETCEQSDERSRH